MAHHTCFIYHSYRYLNLERTCIDDLIRNTAKCNFYGMLILPVCLTGDRFYDKYPFTVQLIVTNYFFRFIGGFRLWKIRRCSEVTNHTWVRYFRLYNGVKIPNYNYLILFSNLIRCVWPHLSVHLNSHFKPYLQNFYLCLLLFTQSHSGVLRRLEANALLKVSLMGFSSGRSLCLYNNHTSPRCLGPRYYHENASKHFSH